MIPCYSAEMWLVKELLKLIFETFKNPLTFLERKIHRKSQEGKNKVKPRNVVDGTEQEVRTSDKKKYYDGDYYMQQYNFRSH